MYYFLKVIISAILIVSISEISKTNSKIGALLASIPLVSVLAIIWIYVENKNIEIITLLSKQIFWMVIPSLLFFVFLPILLKYGLNFWLSMLVSLGGMILGYYFMMKFYIVGST